MSGEPEDVEARIARLLRQQRAQGVQVRPEPPAPSPAELRERERIAAEFERIRAQPAPDLLAAARPARHRDQLTGYDRDLTLLIFARTLAERDPVRAGAVAEHIANDQTRGYTLAAIARPDHLATPADPAPAESAAQRDPSVANLSRAATALARTNHGRAEEIALTIPDETRRHAALSRIVGALVELDPDRAEVPGSNELLVEALAIASWTIPLAAVPIQVFETLLAELTQPAP